MDIHEFFSSSKLRYITLSDNAKTGFKARELKSVHVDAVGKYLRLVIYKNYVNKYNMYNQASHAHFNFMYTTIK